MYFIFILSVFEVAPLLVLYVLFVTCECVSLNWGCQWDQKVLDLCKYILFFSVNMFPRAGVPVGPEYLIKFQNCCLMPLFHCTGGGGFVVIG